MAGVEDALERARAAGRPSLVGYVTAGIRAGWLDLLAAVIEAGADAVEIGLPFSDPMLDGPVIQQASQAAIGRGATPAGILAELAGAGPQLARLRAPGGAGPVPLIAMSYASHAYRRGVPEYCADLAAAGFSGTIIPDLPAAEADEYLAAAPAAGLDATLMVTPATPAGQITAIARASRGFLYVMSVMDTTGAAWDRDDGQRWALAARAAQDSPRPVLIGFGIDSPQRAAAAARHADGVIVASALMRRVLDGAGPAAIGRAVAELRAAVDAAR
jgi:tryptophan synthase alpha chain